MEINKSTINELYKSLVIETGDKVREFLDVNLQVVECMYNVDIYRNAYILKANIEMLNILLDNYLNDEELEECILLSNKIVARIGPTKTEAVMLKMMMNGLEMKLNQTK